MKRYFTTPIYYVNDRPHLGTAYTTVLTDVIARWHQRMGNETYFLTGTDEHGQKVQQAAEARGVSPQAHCDELHEAFRSLWPQLHIAPNDFIRTTESRHKQVVQDVLSDLHAQELIYSKEYGGWYSVSEERFWTEKDLVDGNCPMSGKPVEWIEEKNYFFRMSNYQEQLIQHINDNPSFIMPEFRRNEVLGFLRQPLEDLCISRPKSRLSWGIELPFDAGYVTYVWFDALLNYLTGLGFPDDPSWESWWAESTHIIGKDILTTHCVYWPTMLMAMGVPLPKHVVAHGWWMMDNAKMSKSLGNVQDPLALKDSYGVDVFRYFLIRDMSMGADSTFSESALVTRNNTELANDLGNLLNRTLNMVEKRFDGCVPPAEPIVPEEDGEVRAMIDELPNRMALQINAYKTHLAVDECMALVRRLNKYLNDTAPFKVVKTDPERAGVILRTVLDGLEAAARWLVPVMPETMAELLRRIGAGDGPLETSATVEKGEPLFPKYELPTVEDEDTTDDDDSPESKGKPMITYDDFTKLDLRVAQIVSAEPIEGSDKLLCLHIDLGEESRQVVAGIARDYTASEVIGKRVVVLANLKPRKVFGVESQAMVLAAQEGDSLFVVSPDGFPSSGAVVS
jgi:methionyl-tRNA synthetase